MAGARKWNEQTMVDGVVTVKLRSWKHFYDYVHTELLTYKSFVFRGQRHEWPLRSSLDRLEEMVPDVDRDALLRLFRSACRGRRGPNPVQFEGDEAENEWWALGQHYGLPTPLLDFTTSPFVAAFFALAEEGDPAHRLCWVYALDEDGVSEKSATLTESKISFVRPTADENHRLLNQSGLFAKLPRGCDVEGWVHTQFRGETSLYRMIRIAFPASDRKLALRDLNRMNINHLTLFPDLDGAAQYCRLAHLVRDY